MALRSLLTRPGSLLALPAGAALLVLFFLPWLSLSAVGREVATASGRELSEGRLAGSAVTVPRDVVDARPWFWGVPGAAGLVLAVGALGTARVLRRRPAGMVLIASSVAGAGLSLAALAVKYTDLPLVATRPTAVFWGSVAAFGFAAFCGLLEIAVSIAAGEKTAGPRTARRRRRSS